MTGNLRAFSGVFSAFKWLAWEDPSTNVGALSEARFFVRIRHRNRALEIVPTLLLSVVSCRLSVVGCRLSVVGCRLLVGCWLLVVGWWAGLVLGQLILGMRLGEGRVRRGVV